MFANKLCFALNCTFVYKCNVIFIVYCPKSLKYYDIVLSLYHPMHSNIDVIKP